MNIIIEKSINNPITKKKRSINKYKNEKNQTELQRERERERGVSLLNYMLALAARARRMLSPLVRKLI